jgi:hypothetical protein
MDHRSADRRMHAWLYISACMHACITILLLLFLL